MIFEKIVIATKQDGRIKKFIVESSEINGFPQLKLSLSIDNNNRRRDQFPD